MSSGACARFKQNAWKKDLCSNCYKGKDEHQPPKDTRPRIYPDLPLLPASQSILKDRSGKKKKKSANVTFPKEESEVIGYGGDAESTDDEDIDDYSFFRTEEDTGDDTGGDEEEEKALKQLTKANTDYNSILDNLNGAVEKPNWNSPLMLGQQQKQTLLVSVQPFSSSVANTPSVNKIPDANKIELKENPDTNISMTITHVADKNEKVKDVLPEKTNDHIETNGLEEKEDAKAVKTVLIEMKPVNEVPSVKEEVRSNPEGRKVHITRGNVITKNHEHVKNKLYIQGVIQNKNENKRNSFSLLHEKNEKCNLDEFNKTVIITGLNMESTVKIADNNKNVLEFEEGPSKDENEDMPTQILTEVTNCSLRHDFVKESKEEVTVKVLKLLNGEGGPAESREMAGEPDGKADSDEQEVPLNPPPRASFLHRDSIPSIFLNEAKCLLTPTTPVDEPNLLESINRSSKRPAPKPPSFLEQGPENPVQEETPQRQETTRPPEVTASPEPSLQEETRKECSSPGPMARAESTPVIPTKRDPPPLPQPRRDSDHRHRPDPSDKKKALRMKVTLKKLLRFGSKEEELKVENEITPKPRPQIIHPLDLNKSAVQVLPSPTAEKGFPETPVTPVSTNSTFSLSGRPSKPPPPPRSESLNLMERLRASTNGDNIYANLGEARSGIAPIKPQRTGSLREAKNKLCQIQSDSENVYECVGVSSAPECDMEQRSLPYYGSETESDIYYPNVTFQSQETKNRQKKKGRSVVHSSLEENYGAVIIANHEALSHLLKQLSNKTQEGPVWCTDAPQHWSDFVLNDQNSTPYTIGNFTFVEAEYNKIPITLAISSSDLDIPKELEPIVKFKDNIPSFYLQKPRSSLQLPGSITVLKRKKVEAVADYAKGLETSIEKAREGILVLLQIVRQLKEVGENCSMVNFVVVSESEDSEPATCYLPFKEATDHLEPEECLRKLSAMLVGKMTGVIEKCGLEEAGRILESWLWGPSTSLPLSALKRWLDLERATALHNLVCAKSLSVHDRLYLHFLVNTDADLLARTSRLVELNTQP